MTEFRIAHEIGLQFGVITGLLWAFCLAEARLRLCAGAPVRRYPRRQG